MRISADESSIVFLSSHNDVNETINLDQIKTIRLLQPLTMQKQLALLEGRAEEVFHSSDHQTYSVEFTDKETITGETVGYSDTSNGLYLYLPKDNEKIVRCFIPKQSISKYQIGLHIGEMLIKENLVHKDHVEEAVMRQRNLRAQRLGDYLSEHKILSREQLDQAILHQEKRPVLKLGEALRELGLITEDQLNAALLKQQKNRKTPLGRILIEMGVVKESVLKGALAKKLGIPYVGLSKFNFDLNATRLISVANARKYGLMPLCMHENALVVAFEDPFNLKATEEIRFLTQLKIVPVMSSHEDIQMAISRHYLTQGDDKYAAAHAVEAFSRGSEYEFHQSTTAETKIDDLASKLFNEDRGIELTLEPVAESDNTLVQLVNKMIFDAHTEGISDIHIETYPGKKIRAYDSAKMAHWRTILKFHLISAKQLFHGLKSWHSWIFPIAVNHKMARLIFSTSGQPNLNFASLPSRQPMAWKTL